MADEKKKPAGADIDDLKARLGLKKPGEGAHAKPGAQVGAPGAIGAPPGMGPRPVVPGPAAPPPAFMQPRPVDVTKDPFAAQMGGQIQRPSLIGEHRPSELAVTAEDQKAISRRNVVVTAVVAVLCVGAGLAFGMMAGSGCSQRKLLDLAIQDGNDLYGIVNDSSKKLSEMKKVVVSAQAKAAQMEYDPNTTARLQDMTKKDSPPPILLNQIAVRNYQLYTGETVPTLFTYAASWLRLYDLVHTHVLYSENDTDALKGWKGKFDKLVNQQYGVIFMKEPYGEVQAVSANLVLVTEPFDPSVKEYKIQFDEGMPVSPDLSPEVFIEGAGDLSAEPEKWIMPIGGLSKLRLEEKAKKRFENYQMRLKEIVELIDSMEKNQQYLINQLGTIAAEK